MVNRNRAVSLRQAQGTDRAHGSEGCRRRHACLALTDDRVVRRRRLRVRAAGAAARHRGHLPDRLPLDREPVPAAARRARPAAGAGASSREPAGRRAPSLFRWHYSDRMLLAVALARHRCCRRPSSRACPSSARRGCPCWPSCCSGPVYLSIVNVGQTFYGFGWESLLLRGRIPRRLPRLRPDRAADRDHRLPAAGWCSGSSSAPA